MEKDYHKSILSSLSEEASFFLQEFSLTDCNKNPESVSEAVLKIRILNKNLISPVYPANSDIKSILNWLVTQYYGNLVDKEIEREQDERIDNGREELSKNDIDLEKIKRNHAYLLAFEKNPGVLNLDEVWKSLGNTSNDSIARKGLTLFLHQNDFLERGYKTIVQVVLNTLNKNTVDYSYIHNDVNNRSLSIKQYFPSEEKEEVDESFQLTVTIETDEKNVEPGIFFDLKMRFFKNYQRTPLKLIPCINEVILSVSRQNANPDFVSYSRRRSTVRNDIEQTFTEDFFNLKTAFESIDNL